MADDWKPVDGATGVLWTAAEEAERDLITETLALTQGRQAEAAVRMGMSRRALLTKMEDFGIARPALSPTPSKMNRKVIVEALARAEGDETRVAGELGISHPVLINAMKYLRVPRRS